MNILAAFARRLGEQGSGQCGSWNSLSPTIAPPGRLGVPSPSSILDAYCSPAIICMVPPAIVVCTLNSPPWRWFESRFSEVRWHFVYTEPARRLERWFNRSVFSRISAGFEAAWKARRLDAALLIAIDPLAAMWCAVASALFDRKRRIVAYAFNLPDLPTGLRRHVMTWAFRVPQRFVVFSSVEIDRYASYFRIPREKFEMHHWAVGIPAVADDARIPNGPYLCAIGGNGRDYRTLFEASRLVPHIPIEVVARPENLEGLVPPSNVAVRCNVPNSVAMRLLRDCRGMVLPLPDANIPVGHVTLVAAMRLGKASVVTASEGIRDYTGDPLHVLSCPPRDVQTLAAAMQQLWSDDTLVEVLARRALAFAERHCSEESAIDQLRHLLREEGLVHSG